jgi:glycosyltransferase involved in cell wall biosynthesis
MRALLVTQHFAPEVTAARARLEAFAQGLTRLDWDVEVLTAVPNHPEGVVQSQFRRRAVVRREMDGYAVSHVWVRARPEKTMFSRLALYASFAAMASVVGSARKRPDVVLVSSPPLPAAAAAALIALRHRVGWVFDVRDIWPEAAVALGELSSERVIRAAERLERRLYASASQIVTVTAPFERSIVSRAPAGKPVTVIPNGTTQMWMDAGEEDVDRAELGLDPSRFILTYAGNVGIAQGLHAAIDAAGSLGDDFRLLVLGAGPLLGEMRRRAEALPAGRVEFRDPVQPQEAARYLRASDALLVPLDAKPELAQFVPSKLFDCAAVGRPVIVAAAGEASRLATEADAALTVAPADAVALADAVTRLRSERELVTKLSARGRAFAATYLRERQIERLDVVLRAAAEDRKRR